MDILNYLDQIRQKPEAQRRRLLVLWTGLGTFIIASLWLVNLFFILPASVADLAVSDSTTTVDSVTATTTQSSTVQDNLGRVIRGVGVIRGMLSGGIKNL